VARPGVRRLAVAVLTGPIGRGGAFVADFTAALWRIARGDPTHPEERPPPG
jgi:hypothetical protein